MIGTSCFLDVFLSKKRTKGEVSDRFSAKTPYNRTTNFPKRNGFFWYVHLVYFDVVLSKNRTEREISEGFSAKTPHKRTTICTKRNGFLYSEQRVFLTRFW